MIELTLLTSALLLQTDNKIEAPSYDTTLNFHFYKQFESSIDTGGDVDASHAGVELRVTAPISDQDSLLYRFQYQRDFWSFSGTSGLGNDDPWGAINTIDFDVQWTHNYSNKTQWFIGGIVRASYEDSATMNTKGGGTIGMAHSFSDNLTLGLGAGVIGQVHDDPRLFPIFVVDWKLNDTLRLTSDISTRFGSRTGLELVWTPRKQWSFGVGYSYSFSRFRLDDDGFTPAGAGEATSWPFTFRATYEVSPSFKVTFLGGVVFGGHLEVTDDARNLVRSTDYENAGGIGILGKITF
jgi:hypothetical protein